MAKYILKRLGYIIIVFFLLSILLFGIFKMVPGDPARLMVEGQKQSVSPEQYEMLYQQARVRLGLDKPIPVQYLSWEISYREISVTLPYIVFRLKN